MKATNKEISEKFSEGNFPFCYEYFDVNIEWNLIGNEKTSGRDNVIAHCDMMMKEMEGSTMKNLNIAGDEENIAIEGICNYTNGDGLPGEVYYCDVFRFKMIN